MLEDIYAKYGINLRDSNGNLRNVVDVLEDMYLKLNYHEFIKLQYEISEEELRNDIFDDSRGRKYKE
ncbi:MAG: hypothetical protein ACOCUD_04095 [Bacillota bacterium]